jgi:tripartite-type tricarboxylate transporter receptor subunit TctC
MTFWFSRGFLGALALFAVIGPAAAQGSPKTLKIIVPWPPGGAADLSCRQLQQPLSEILGQPVVVENKSGAGGIVGSEALARSPGDGTTIGMVISSHASNTALHAKLPYDAIKDFKPITILVKAPNMIGVHPGTPYKSVSDIIAAAKAQPGKLHYASSGNGTAQHLGFEHIKIETGTSLSHVPFRGAGPALNDLVAGQIEIAILNIAGMLPHVQAGRVRALAVTSPKRSPMAPDVPTVAETLPGFDFTEWFALMAPGGTPDDVVEKLYAAIAKAARTPAFENRMKEAGMELGLNTPAEFRAVVAADIEKFGTLVKKAKITID